MRKKDKNDYWIANPWGGEKRYFSDKKPSSQSVSLFWKIIVYGVILFVLFIFLLYIWKGIY